MTNTVRLHSKGIHLGYKRNLRNQQCGQSRLLIDGIKDRIARMPSSTCVSE
ncbi:unnamed protein product [Chondrus crispus]|uniref:Uncharacterized protein n=1 Tax=Chondrus crispus TaxID=2769 RepID=R7Q7G3_CHOCR|nr:unnamed protein product [Chondrus crispus]XP_005712030.1 unnamed protein product [Chondrus crispus]XP_005713129.1 unnamed protein product [Chondrus crispus]XP_005715745.1 unnamed protein product [Chondrus crispus]CDF32365.1 unnamed protein product [Chondrus crispus]CDF33326.1 unnamed protein product [Chondrus crispus]CDF35926.1 unnamed protein product [Chondrus crispus]CDF40790.1 unnamed protein product [Chondrus crispus]|eukprot:XP_005711084.1 unnamed protein product [Chondrus crispus]